MKKKLPDQVCAYIIIIIQSVWSSTHNTTIQKLNSVKNSTQYSCTFDIASPQNVLAFDFALLVQQLQKF